MHKIISLMLCLMLTYPSLILAANTVEGKKIYTRNCAMCHGVQGVSTMASAADFKQGDSIFKSDFTLLEHIKKGKNSCPAFIGILREQQIFDVIAYLRTLYK
jgi:cytochrome c6